MFRYIGFSWNPSDPEQADLAQQLDEALFARQAWRPACKWSGHRVYTTGQTRGVNGIYLLPSNQGVILGRLFRRQDSVPAPAGDLELSEHEANRIVHSDGRALIDEFWGRYVAFLPSWTGEGRVLRDPTGTLPCYRLRIQGVSIVLSWLDDLYALLDTPAPVVNWEAIAAHMLFGRLGGRETALAGVTQILPGELTPMEPRSNAPLVLWSAVDVARRRPQADAATAAQRLRATTVACVQAWASCYEAMVLRLSGGVDSAILLGSLCHGVPPQRVTCLNYHSPGSDSDERHFARLVAQRAGAQLIERPLDPEFRLEEVLNIACTPVPANYIGGMGSIHFDAEVAAAHQAGAVLTGAGGDQLFFEFRCTWPAADYLKLRGFDRGFLEAALDSAHLGYVSFWRALHRAVVDRSFRGNPAEGAGRFLTLMRAEAMESAARLTERFVHPGWLAATDLPIGKFHQVGALICPFEYYNTYRREASPERVHPFMSQPLLELSLATPTYVLTQGGQGRALARKAFADDLPAEIAARRSKGGMEEHAVSVLRRNLPFARELLLDGHLAKQGLLARERVETALSGRPSSTAAYVSEIHTCIALEAWIQRIAGRTGRRAG